MEQTANGFQQVLHLQELSIPMTTLQNLVESMEIFKQLNESLGYGES